MYTYNIPITVKINLPIVLLRGTKINNINVTNKTIIVKIC